MKANIFKRVSAYLIDYFIVMFILSLITMGIGGNSTITKEINNLAESYANKEITIEEYSEKTQELNYELQKSNVAVNAVSVTLFIGYFIVFAYFNKGQTIGKKLLKIKVVENNKKPSIKAMIIRGLFVYGILTGLYTAIFVNILSKKYFNYGSAICSYIELFFVVVSFFMVLYKKDGRGLHDLMAGTSVIEEVKENGKTI